MRSVSYYSFDDKRENGLGNCSIALDTSPLIVNCAGRLVSSSPFTTYNTEGRLDYYLLHILTGKLIVRMPDGEKCVSAGDSVIFPPNYKYFYKYAAEGEPLCYLWVHFTGSAAGKYLSDLGFSDLPALCQTGRDTLAELYFERMFELYSSDGFYRAHALSAVFLEMLVGLAESRMSEKKECSLSRSLAYINSRYTERIRIDELANLENLSPSRYHVIFKERMGMPPSEYIIELRLRHASGLLSSTDMSVSQVASLVGYDDQRFFCRLFKKKLGITPTEYRRVK